MMDCQKEQFNDRCCCNCKNQVEIRKHPWNKGDAKGSISDTMGYGCKCPDFYDGNQIQMIVFFDTNHGMCEMHELRT